MKAIILSLTMIFGLLFTMASCQSLGAQRVLNSYDQLQTEIVYNGEDLEGQVASIVEKADVTKSLAVRRAEFN